MRQKRPEKSPESEGWMCKVKCGPFGKSKEQDTFLQPQMAFNTGAKRTLVSKERTRTLVDK